MKNSKNVKGAKAWVVFLPTIILILILLMAFVIINVLMTKRSEKDADTAHQTTTCVSLVSSLQSRSSSMQETISSFIYQSAIPVEFGEHGPTRWAYNNQPLGVYYNSLINEDTKPEVIYEKVENKLFKYNILVDDETGAGKRNAALADLRLAIQDINNMFKVQKRAIYLVSQLSYPGYEIPNYILEAVGSYTFTTEDMEIISGGNESIRTAAIEAIFEKDYASSKKDIADLISKVIGMLNEENVQNSEKSDEVVWALRRTLWALTALIIIALFVFYMILHFKLLKPITTFARNIQENEMLNEEKGLYEANYLAMSYNELLNKKSDFENQLASVAETDPLTGFENRYSYNKFLASKTDSSHSTCIFMLDINNLKYVNDTFGHDKGDELIKNSSLAIKETFMNEDGKNCYRLGGDEFIAILDNIEEANIPNYIMKFQEKQEKYEVSIATGYAYTSDVSIDGYEKLMIEADKRMYENKKEMKEKMNKK